MVHKDTLYEWAKVHPEFSDAMRLGKIYRQNFWETLLISGTRGSIVDFKQTACMFVMRTQFDWREEMRVAGKDGGPIETLALAAKEASRLDEIERQENLD